MKQKVVDAFGYFGARVRNIQQSWSARTPDGASEKTVALLIWKNEEEGVVIARPDKLIFNNFAAKRFPNWRDKRGNRYRSEDLQWAIDNCDGHFRVVWGKMKDPDAEQAHAIERYPDKTLVMKITEFEPETGRFRAESISGWTGNIPEAELRPAAALGSRGGKARAKRLTPQQRTASARQAARSRWRAGKDSR